MRYYSFLISLLWLMLVLPLAAGGEDELLQQLQAIPGAEVEEIPPIPGYHRTFRIFLTQPLDHGNPAGKTFRQKIYLCHLNGDRPMVLGTEGYQVFHPAQYEISAILNANQLIVEHRFFNDSRPDSLDWRYLTIKQAAATTTASWNFSSRSIPANGSTPGPARAARPPCSIAAIIHRMWM